MAEERAELQRIAQKPQLLMNGNGFVGNGVLAIMLAAWIAWPAACSLLLPACLPAGYDEPVDEAQH